MELTASGPYAIFPDSWHAYIWWVGGGEGKHVAACRLQNSMPHVEADIKLPLLPMHRAAIGRFHTCRTLSPWSSTSCVNAKPLGGCKDGGTFG